MAELAAPCVIEIEFDERFRAKSGAGGEGGGPEEVLPQAAQTNASEREIANGTPCRNRPMR